MIIALDADLLSSGLGCLRYARQFARRRRPQPGPATMSRLYAVECTPSNTGAMADHRLPLRASEIETFTRTLALAVRGVPEAGAPLPYAAWLGALARDLLRHRGRSVAIPGDYQSPGVHLWAHVVNHALGNVGSTVIYTDPVEAEPVDQTASLRELVADMDAGRVEWLIILDGNPVYNSPADLAFGERLLKVPMRMHLSLYQDETSALCQWHIPEAHYLEAWSDTRALDGTASIVQPLIARSGCLRLSPKCQKRERRRSQHATRLPKGSNLSSGRTRPSSTADLPITAGCRNCQSLSPDSPGTTPRWLARPRPSGSA